MEATATPPPRKRKRRRVMHISLGAIALLLILLAAGIAYLLSEAGLPFLIARVVAQSGGRLTVEGASGSIGRTMRFRRLVWRGEEVTVTADDVALDWNPGALTSLRPAGSRATVTQFSGPNVCALRSKRWAEPTITW